MSWKRRFVVFAPATVLACALAGGLVGPKVGVAAAASGEDVDESFRKFSSVLAAIERNYAEQVDLTDSIYQGAIPRMLRALDPHSQFFDPESFRRLRDDQKGHYAGVGMQIQYRDGVTVVMAPFPRTPAYRAGLRPGDIIVEVDGESTEGWNTTEVANHLRGPEGTEVQIGIERPGVEGIKRVTVVRDRIRRPSVPVAFELRPGVGFIRIDSFNEKTGEELDKAIKKVGGENLKGLVLDLRGNRGGLLSQGVYVSGKFLEKGQTIVSHYGRRSTERTYKAQRGAGGVRYPMVVMVNCESASASEIVAGALQDHDRAVIVGSPTFGKGLVQTVYPLLDQTAGLALTTARYYTPSGRLIQRRYDGVSMIDYYSDPCSERYKPEHDEVRLTDAGRQVFGGGGITPDIRFDDRKMNDFQILMRRKFAFETFAQEFTLKNPKLAPGWEPTDEAVEEFRQFLYREKHEFSEADFLDNLGFIKRFLEREVYNSAYDYEEGQKVYYMLDPDVEKAVEALPQATRLLEGSTGLVADKGDARR